MTIIKTDFSSQQSHIRRYPTKIINLIGGPGVGKSILASVIFVHLKLAGKSAEYVQEYAKSLVWQKDLDTLKNQYFISQQQYKMLKVLDGELQYVVTDGPLAQQLYYNQYYADNICNVSKTKEQIIKWMSEFDNINILIERNTSHTYEQAGRYQNETQATSIDPILEQLLIDEGIQYFKVKSDIAIMNEFVKNTILKM